MTCVAEAPETADQTAEKLRQEPYRLFRNDCLTKSIRLCAKCRRKGTNAYLVWCLLGLAKARLPLLGEVTIPIFTHCWAEVDGRRFETSRPLGSRGHLGIVPRDIKPLITIKV